MVIQNLLHTIDDLHNNTGLGRRLETRLSWPEEEIRGFTEFLSAMLRISPLERASAFELVRHPWLDIEHDEPSEKVF